jgi:hypothetical protein
VSKANPLNDENVVVTATVALFWEQVVSCHQDTQGPLYELALEGAAENAKGWAPKGDLHMIHSTDLEAALETIITRAKRQIERLRAATELRGES